MILEELLPLGPLIGVPTLLGTALLVRVGLVPAQVLKVIFPTFFLLFGLLMVTSQAQRWQLWQGLGPDAARTTSTAGQTGAKLGCWYRIQVGGQQYSCPGGMRDPEPEAVAILYDPSQPERCREERFSEGMGPYEKTSAVLSSFFGLAGVWFFVAALRGRVRYGASLGGPGSAES